MRLNVKAFALTTGTMWGAGFFLMTWWMILTGDGSDTEFWMGRFYLGYRLDPVGSLIGLAWALPDGFIGGALFAWVYNRFAGSTIPPTPGDSS